MPFAEEFSGIKRRVFIVGCFNDTEEKRGKFYLLGKKPVNVGIADGGHYPKCSYDNFVELIQPQLSAVESGLLDETNWFFRIGGRPDDETRAVELLSRPGFPGESIFETIKSELRAYESLLAKLVDDDFNTFASTLSIRGSWEYGEWLPPGLLAAFLEGLAENWLLDGRRPATSAELTGFAEWQAKFEYTDDTSSLLSYMEGWTRKEFQENADFKERVQSLQRLGKLCNSRTLLKLLVYWPYQHILHEARNTWESIRDKNPDEPAIKKASSSSRYDAWDFLLGTAWVNKQPVADVKGETLKRSRPALQKLLDDGGAAPPNLADPVQRDSFSIRQQQIEDHVRAWTQLYSCDSLDSLLNDESSSSELKTLLECKGEEDWEQVRSTAQSFHSLWDLGPAKTEQSTRLRQNSAETFAKLAVRETFGELFQSPGFDPTKLLDIYEQEFIKIFAWCLLQSNSQDNQAMRTIGAKRASGYQPPAGKKWSEAECEAERSALRFTVSVEASQKLIDLAQSAGHHVKIAECEPAIRAFAHGVNAQVHKMQGMQSLLYLLRYSPQEAGSGQATMERNELWKQVMREGLKTQVLSAVANAVDRFNSDDRRKMPERKARLEFCEAQLLGGTAAPPAQKVAVPASTEGAAKYKLRRDAQEVGFRRGSFDDENELVSPDVAALETELGEFLLGEEHKLADSIEPDLNKARESQEDLKRAIEAGDPEDIESKRGDLVVVEKQVKDLEEGITPVDVTVHIDTQKLNSAAEFCLRRFQDAWRTIFDHASGPGSHDTELKNGLHRLLLTEFLLVVQRQLDPEKDHWVDLQLLLDLVGSGSLEAFLKSYSLTKYSDKIDGNRGLTKRFKELQQHAQGSLEAMRQVVSDLHGMKLFLNSAKASDAQVVVFNGTADEYLEALIHQNLSDDSPVRYLELLTGQNGKPSETFFAPACVYFTGSAFEGGELEKQGLALKLQSLELRRGRYAMALPPSIADSNPLAGPETKRWPKELQWPTDNPLRKVPLHWIAPSPWLRPPSDAENFSTVLPAGFLLLSRLINPSTDLTAFSSVAASLPDWMFSLSDSTGPIAPSSAGSSAENLMKAFALESGRPSFVLTFNLYLCLVDALIRNAQTLKQHPVRKELVEFIGEYGPNQGFRDSLASWISFSEQPEVAVKKRTDEAFLSSVRNDWRLLWWNPIQQDEDGSTTLAPMKTFAMTAETVGKVVEQGPEFTSDFVGWVNEIVARY